MQRIPIKMNFNKSIFGVSFQLRNFWFLISKFLSRVFFWKVHKVFNDLRGGAAPHPGALGLSSTDQIKK